MRRIAEVDLRNVRSKRLERILECPRQQLATHEGASVDAGGRVRSATDVQRVW